MLLFAFNSTKKLPTFTSSVIYLTWIDEYNETMTTILNMRSL